MKTFENLGRCLCIPIALALFLFIVIADLLSAVLDWSSARAQTAANWLLE